MRLQHVLNSVQTFCAMNPVATPSVVIGQDLPIPQAKGWTRTSAELLAYYESKILGHLKVPHRLYQVSLQTDNKDLQCVANEYINTLEIDQSTKSASPPLVVVHGIVKI